jgi:hypothetical protein
MFLALRRIHENGDYDTQKAKRALYHAIGMAGMLGSEEMTNLRNALRLP